MQLSDPRKLKIVESLSDPFDFETFQTECYAQGLTLHGTELEFAQKIGMLIYAKKKYPEATPLEAYMLFVSGASSHELVSGCNGCGGGEIK